MDTHEIRILYLGTPEISAFVLEALINAKYNIIGVVSQQDKEQDRKHNFLPTETKKVALLHNIPVYQYDKIRLHVEEVKALKPDLILTLAYGQLVPQTILDMPKFGCINLHGSILPKYRGAAPIQRVLLNGEKETGFTLMQMIDKMDAGLMYAKNMVKISESDNYSSLLEKMKVCARDLILKNLDSYLEGKLKGEPQNDDDVTFANKISKDDEKLSLEENTQDFLNHIRALAYVPGSYLLLEGQIIKIFKAHFVSSEISGKDNGTILSATKNGIYVQLNDGVIAIDELQKQQKKMIKTIDFINGVHNLEGKKFE